MYGICFGSELPGCRSPHPKLLWKCLFSFMIIFSLSFEDPLSLRISNDHPCFFFWNHMIHSTIVLSCWREVWQIFILFSPTFILSAPLLCTCWYSRTSCKRPTKMRRFSGQDLVAYEVVVYERIYYRAWTGKIWFVFTKCFLYFCCFCSWPWHICNKQTKPQ